MKKISVIIPMYNAEAFITQCIRSVTEQTYQNWEAVVVDDGSLDQGAVICEKMSREDLQDLLEQTVVELGRLARTSPQKARVLKAAALTARLREAAELNVGGGAAAGWLCGEMFLK